MLKATVQGLTGCRGPRGPRPPLSLGSLLPMGAVWSPTAFPASWVDGTGQWEQGQSCLGSRGAPATEAGQWGPEEVLGCLDSLS